MQYQSYSLKNINKVENLNKLPVDIIESIKVVGSVLPFKSNNYVIDELIDWDNFEEDPLFTLTFPRKEMLDPSDYTRVKKTAWAKVNLLI